MKEGYNITFYLGNELAHLVFEEYNDAAFVIELIKNFYEDRLGDKIISNAKFVHLIRLLEHKHNISQNLSDSLPSLDHEYPEELIHDLLGIFDLPESIKGQVYCPIAYGLKVYFIEDLVDITDAFSFTQFDI
ncbi:hypothetical protein fHeYen901_114 [Yersinia phage fHe-Yen9-01]|uniref:Uncharacterized protein n=1 Tax=Yersinia phage fHe-Yen9-01 TaxID=1965363 RepID=A0A1V0DXL0_9CAUD|nr:hypothetical protein KNT60_gp113 [Yersinia phage fHe-Yen9-01]ARB05887.1 hypothetical protein fHeYen901_114 [Yersinia phage fHe-Yen9-01]